MEKHSLTTNQKNLLRRSSRLAVSQSFNQLKPHVIRQRWLGIHNRYSADTVNRLKVDLGTGGTLNSRHMAQYIAASGPLHCTDGWTYLGRAIVCHARGDSQTARHLAYYAELRAAMALLAAEGVGIFSGQHIVLDASQNCHKIPKSVGTHVICWLVLEHWADLMRSSDLLVQIISPGSVPLHEWLDQFGAGKTTRLIASETLKSWGLDLKYLSEDREARNEASYRPDRLQPRNNVGASDASEFMRNLWMLFEPLPSSRFETLDRHLLRITLERAFTAVSGRSVRDDPAGFEFRVDKMLSNVSPLGLSTLEWKSFLLRTTASSTPAVLQEAAGKEAPKTPKHHMQVIARASLLLRVATGASQLLIKNASFPTGDLAFWWNQVGKDVGLWDNFTAPADTIDLWADVESALEELKNWEDENVGVAVSIAKLWLELSRPLALLSTSERIALWGLGL